MSILTRPKMSGAGGPASDTGPPPQGWLTLLASPGCRPSSKLVELLLSASCSVSDRLCCRCAGEPAFAAQAARLLVKSFAACLSITWRSKSRDVAINACSLDDSAVVQAPLFSVASKFCPGSSHYTLFCK